MNLGPLPLAAVAASLVVADAARPAQAGAQDWPNGPIRNDSAAAFSLFPLRLGNWIDHILQNPIRANLETVSFSNSSRLGINSLVNALKPVTLPPGRASSAITPLVSGPRPLSFRQIRRSPEGVGTVPVGTCCSLD